MTLNAFHSAGIGRMSATTGGVPRIKEILGLSKKIKTPQMIISLTDQYMNSRDMANKIGSYIKYITIGQLRKQIDVYYEPDPFAKGSYREKDNVYNVFYGHNPGKHSCQADIFNLPWLMRIVFDREKLLEKEVTLLDIKSKFCNAWEKRFSDIKSSKKEERAIFDKITQCAILSNTNNIRLIKTDTDGFDYDVLNSSISTIKKNKPLIFFEYQFENKYKIYSYLKTFKQLEKIGYCDWVIFDNYGTIILRTNQLKIIKQLTNYINLQNNLRGTRTIYYFDILTCVNKDSKFINKILKNYHPKSLIN